MLSNLPSVAPWSLGAFWWREDNEACDFKKHFLKEMNGCGFLEIFEGEEKMQCFYNSTTGLQLEWSWTVCNLGIPWSCWQQLGLSCLLLTFFLCPPTDRLTTIWVSTIIRHRQPMPGPPKRQLQFFTAEPSPLYAGPYSMSHHFLGFILGDRISLSCGQWNITDRQSGSHQFEQQWYHPPRLPNTPPNVSILMTLQFQLPAMIWSAQFILLLLSPQLNVD